MDEMVEERRSGAGAPWKQMRVSFIGSVWLGCSLAVRDYETPKVPGTLTIRLLKDSPGRQGHLLSLSTSSLPLYSVRSLLHRETDPILARFGLETANPGGVLGKGATMRETTYSPDLLGYAEALHYLDHASSRCSLAEAESSTIWKRRDYRHIHA